MLVVNADSFKKMNLAKAGYESNPLEDEDFRKKYHLVELDLTNLTKEALAESSSQTSDKTRCKNFFAFGFHVFCLWTTSSRPSSFLMPSGARNFLRGRRGEFLGLESRLQFGRYSRDCPQPLSSFQGCFKSRVYRKISGNEAMVYGLVVAAKKANRELLYSGYPITPASPVLEGLSQLKKYGVKCVQAEDEIAAMGVALGASFAGDLSVWRDQWTRDVPEKRVHGLASITELPLIICNAQRGGPSTGLPTKTEQSDLLQALFSRHGDCPIPVLAAHSPSDCFDCAWKPPALQLPT